MTQILGHYFLQNAGSTNMAVDGSVTPVLFDISNIPFRTFSVTSMHLYVEGKGDIQGYDNFWTLPNALANGFAVTATVQNQTFTGDTFNTTRDILTDMDSMPMMIKRDIEGNKNSIRTEFKVDSGGLILSQASGNQFSITIQDDLSDLSFMSFAVKGIVLL